MMGLRGTATAKGMGAWQQPVSLRQVFGSALLSMAILCTGILGGCAGLVNGTKTTTGQAAFQVSPTTVNFGKVGVGKQTTQTIAVANTGTMPVSITQATVSNPQFSLTGVTLPMSVATGQSGNFTVAVTPSATGTLSGTLTVQGSAGAAPAVVNLSATAVAAAPQMSLSSASIQFGTVGIGSTANMNLTISNTGSADLTVSAVSLTGAEFSVSGITTPKTIVAGQSAVAGLSFQPKVGGAAAATLSIMSNDPAHPTMSVAMAGTGFQSGISLTPSSANFGSVAVGSTNSQTIQIGNPGTSVLTITQAIVTGTGFSTTGLTVPVSINPGQSTTFNAKYQPTATGAASGSITLVSNAASSPTVVALTGTGVVATQTLSFSTNTVSFGNVATGTSSTLPVTVTDTGNSNVQISQIAASGSGYTLSGASAPVTLAPSQSLTFNVIFSPTVTGSVSGSVTITSNATGSPSTITLSGNGAVTVTHSASLSWTASTSTVSGYNVYRSTTSGAGYTKLNGSLVSLVNYTDSTVANGTTYYYVTTAVDANGLESINSNEAVAVIP